MNKNEQARQRAEQWVSQLRYHADADTAQVYGVSVGLALFSFTYPSSLAVWLFVGGYLVTWLGRSALFAWEETTRHA